MRLEQVLRQRRNDRTDFFLLGEGAERRSENKRGINVQQASKMYIKVTESLKRRVAFSR